MGYERPRDRALRSRLVQSLGALLIVVVCLGGSLLRARASGVPEGVDLAGKPVDPLHSEPGKAVVLVFVRTDCPISNRYAPTIQRLSAEYAGKVTFWLVYPDRTESVLAIQKHLQEYGYKLPALRDPQHSLVKFAGVQVTPEVALFDSAGKLLYHGRIDNWYQDFGHARSAPTTHELSNAIQAFIKGKTPEVASASGVGCYISDLE